MVKIIDDKDYAKRDKFKFIGVAPCTDLSVPEGLLVYFSNKDNHSDEAARQNLSVNYDVITKGFFFRNGVETTNAGDEKPTIVVRGSFLNVHEYFPTMYVGETDFIKLRRQEKRHFRFSLDSIFDEGFDPETQVLTECPNYEKQGLPMERIYAGKLKDLA